MKNLSVDELHLVLLKTAKAFHEICVRNDIPYYMLGGTMLGAVRHHGFIPWDDDMDFGVPRQYYEKMKQLLKTELEEPYEVLSVENSDSMILDYVKIQDKRTIVNELYRENIKCSYGVNIDVFPLDRTFNRHDSLKSKAIETLKNLQQYLFLSAESRPPIKRAIAVILKKSLFFLERGSLIRFINRYLIESEGQYVANHYGAWGCRETVPLCVFGTSVLYAFEDTHLYGVEQPNDYLKSLYGDYMRLPPDNERHLHLSGVYWRN